VINTYNLNPFYFPTLFPLLFTPTLNWKSLIADIGIPIMADVVSFDSTSPRKTRQVLSRAQGDIPKISFGRDKTESDLNEYNQLLHYAQTSQEAAKRILDWIYNDTEFCWTGVNARLEYLALRAASTGKVQLNKQNNAGVITEIDVDFLVPDAQKTGVAQLITEANAANSKPITVFKTLQKAAKGKGFRLMFAYMDQDTLDNILISAETVKKVAPFIMQAVDLAQPPTLDQLNKYLAQNNLPVIAVIDQQLTFEDANGTRTVLTPWEPGVVAFAAEKVLGNTFHAPLADESITSPAIKVKRGHVLIKRFAVEEPLTESTLGMANAFPALGNASRMYLLDTLHANFLTN
jgi:hypothetical protein